MCVWFEGQSCPESSFLPHKISPRAAFLEHLCWADLFFPRDSLTALHGRYLEIFPRLLASFPAHAAHRDRLPSVLCLGDCDGVKTL